MNFSDEWRSLFPIPSIFPSPPLISSAAVGPLHLRPLEPQPHLLLSHLPSLQIPPPLHPPSHLAALRSFFNSSSFLPHSLLSSLLASHLPSPDVDPTSSNLLCSLPSRSSPSSALLFFPTGDNSHSLCIALLKFDESVAASKISVHSEGFKHPYHRILKLSAVPASSEHDSAGITVEGFLIAVTLYSANWFRVETREKGGIFVVPIAKQGFESSVVDACLCRSWPERSVVLLENGELCWFDMESRRSGKIRVCEGLGGLLGCEFGGQPWIVIVACQSAVVAVDLRARKVTEPKVLVRMDEGRSDQILAFRSSRVDDFYMAVVTEKQVLLFDTRKPLVPVLMWDHGLLRPCYVCIYRLSELRPSEEFRWASDSGYVILVGSFWKDEFNLFFYGPKEGGGAFGSDSMVYAWELPFSFSLSGRNEGLGDRLMEVGIGTGLECWKRKDVVVGFWIVPNNLLKVKLECGGFALIRLMLSGRLEIQRYHASWDPIGEKSNGDGVILPKISDLIVCPMEQKGKTSSRNYSLNVAHLWEYMNCSFSSLIMRKPPLSEFNQSFPSDLLGVLKGKKQECSTSPISASITDATIPMSIFEITLRRVLNSMEPDLLPLAFSRYSLLFEDTQREAAIALLEVPHCLPHHKSVPFFVGNPLRLSEKWSRKAPSSDALVGPVFPIPILLLIQWMNSHEISPHLKEEPDGDILSPQSQATLENLYPEVSLADTGRFSEHECSIGMQNKSFFVYEKSLVGNASTCKRSVRMAGFVANDERPQTEHDSLEPATEYEDEKFTTFVCGVADKTCYLTSEKEASGFEVFDQLNPYMLDFDSSSIEFQPKELEIYKRLTRQSYKWLGNFKPHDDFCISSEVPKPPH